MELGVTCTPKVQVRARSSCSAGLLPAAYRMAVGGFRGELESGNKISPLPLFAAAKSPNAGGRNEFVHVPRKITSRAGDQSKAAFGTLACGTSLNCSARAPMDSSKACSNLREFSEPNRGIRSSANSALVVRARLLCVAG